MAVCRFGCHQFLHTWHARDSLFTTSPPNIDSLYQMTTSNSIPWNVRMQGCCQGLVRREGRGGDSVWRGDPMHVRGRKEGEGLRGKEGEELMA